MNSIAVGVDIAKLVFQVHYVDQETGEIVNKPIKRARFLEHFANRAPCLIGMEACSGAHHWARQLMKMGHEVKLMPANLRRRLTSATKMMQRMHGRSGWRCSRPGKPVAVKTETQQAMLALHRMRQQLVKFRTMQINSLRGLLTEYGEVMGKGRAALDKAIPGVLDGSRSVCRRSLIDTLREQWNGLTKLDEQIAQIERRMRRMEERGRGGQGDQRNPGRGLLTATAAVATMGDAKAFRSGREFAAWIGIGAEADGLGWQGESCTASASAATPICARC